MHFGQILKAFRLLPAEIHRDRVFSGAAAMAFYSTLASIPALISILALLSYMPLENLQNTLTILIKSNFPGHTGYMLIETGRELIQRESPGILSIGFLVALWASSSGMSAIIDQINIAYKTKRHRSFVKDRFLSLVLTFLYVSLTIAATSLILVSQAFRNLFGNSITLLILFTTTRYFIASGVLVLAFVLIYYFAPTAKQKVKLVLPGSILGSFLLVVFSMLFDFYISNVANYDQIYGRLAGIIAFMLWLYVTGFVLLLGAEFNALLFRLAYNSKKH